jgi:hypothetical protein
MKMVLRDFLFRNHGEEWETSDFFPSKVQEAFIQGGR